MASFILKQISRKLNTIDNFFFSNMINRMIKKFVGLWLPVICWAGLIFFLSSLPNLRTNFEALWDTILRKAAHLTEYGILFLLLSRPMNKSLKWAVILCFIYALSDEFHQSFIPGREMALADICFDSAGVLTGYLANKKRSVAKY